MKAKHTMDYLKNESNNFELISYDDSEGNKFIFSQMRDEIINIETENEKLTGKIDDYNCLLKSNGEQLIFKISANVDEIEKMMTIENGGDYTIFVPDAFKIGELHKTKIANLSKEILTVLFESLNERMNREMSD